MYSANERRFVGSLALFVLAIFSFASSNLNMRGLVQFARTEETSLSLATRSSNASSSRNFASTTPASNAISFNTTADIEIVEKPEGSGKDVKFKEASWWKLLHMGKDGGGTIREIARTDWRIRLLECHPEPCPFVFKRFKGFTSQLVTIRDPIDRFVSAFYYRGLRLEEKAFCLNSSFTYYHGTKDCKKVQREYPLYYDVWKKNVTKFAIGLCSANETLRNHTLYEKKHFGHVGRYDLHNWLVPGKWEMVQDLLYPIVMERGFNFIEEVDASFEWAYTKTPFEPKEDFARRRAFQEKRREKRKKSSVYSQHLSGKESQIPLSSLGSSCLRKYFEKDYQQLKEVRDICKSEYCSKAIQSILDRREVT